MRSGISGIRCELPLPMSVQPISNASECRGGSENLPSSGRTHTVKKPLAGVAHSRLYNMAIHPTRSDERVCYSRGAPQLARARESCAEVATRLAGARERAACLVPHPCVGWDVAVQSAL